LKGCCVGRKDGENKEIKVCFRKGHWKVSLSSLGFAERRGQKPAAHLPKKKKKRKKKKWTGE